MSRLTVQMFHQQARHQLGLSLLAGRDGLWRAIEALQIQRPGLALTGFVEHFKRERIQVLGFSEVAYLRSLSSEALARTLHTFLQEEPPCVVVTRGLEPPSGMLTAADEHKVCLFSTPLLNSVFVDRAMEFLDEKLSQIASLHGVLVDVMGLGVLLMGPSGIGKSEVALELVSRGHRLVADDIVDLRKRPPDSVFGAPSEIIRHHMEIRGMGIINIRDLFGVTAVRHHKKVELVVELVSWDENEEYERLGVDDKVHTILGVPIPKIVLPLRAGRVISTLVEVAARDRLLKNQGIHSAREFQSQLSDAIGAPETAGRDSDDEVE
ncbi:MAG: HPr(Ser) kinase/phosphatase [bacterium]